MKIGYFFIFLNFLCGTSLSFAMDGVKEEGELPVPVRRKNNEVGVIIFSAHLPMNQYRVQLTARHRHQDGSVMLNDADLAPLYKAWQTKKDENNLKRNFFPFLCFFSGVCLSLGCAVTYYHTFLKK
jgi:hypothetical protein